MRKQVAMLMIFITAAVLLAGCPRQPAQPEEITETVLLYYGDEGNENLVEEEREISYREGEDRYQVVLEELITGSQTLGYTANISSDTVVYGTILQEDSILVNMSREFAQFGGSVAETIAVLSVVNTLTQFEEIMRVKILVEGEELIGPSGEPRGFMERFDPEQSPGLVEQTVILYYANEDATALVPEERTLQFSPDAELAERLALILEELILGPQNPERVATIPRQARVLSVDVEERLATVNFSEEMETEHSAGAAAETMTILSIVNTLTEFEAVQFVQMNVEGEPMNIDQIILDAPVERNEAIIEQAEE